MAIRLAEGGQVEFHGLVIGAKRYSVEIDPCNECEMDCICDMEMQDLCHEIDIVTRKKCLLYLPNEHRKYGKENV